tara:strand:+ start:171 stop:974 length:804 start_codon:yes stop_codon:yes gene_type:complete
MSNYIIAIPSYKRENIIKDKTLSTLQKYNINRKLIYIFVSDQLEYDIYNIAIPKNFYNKIVIGKIGLKNQRNFISNYFKEGTCIVQLDDDIDNIVELVNDSKIIPKTKTNRNFRKKNKLKSISDLNKFIKDAFKICKKEKIYLWGVYPIANPYFMTLSMDTKLNFIVGPFWGMINRHSKDLKQTINEKENVERTLQFYIKDKAVLRFNYISIITKYYKNKGGMQFDGIDRKFESLKSVRYLHNKYPALTKIDLTKKSGMPEIRLIKK